MEFRETSHERLDLPVTTQTPILPLLSVQSYLRSNSHFAPALPLIQMSSAQKEEILHLVPVSAYHRDSAFAFSLSSFKAQYSFFSFFNFDAPRPICAQ